VVFQSGSVLTNWKIIEGEPIPQISLKTIMTLRLEGDLAIETIGRKRV